MDQFEEVIVYEKGKVLEAWIWSQIQSLVKKLQVLFLQKSTGSQKKDCCRKPKKDGFSNGNAVAENKSFTSTRQPNSKSCVITKRKRLSPLKTEVPEADRPVFQRQHGVVENSCEKDYTL